MHQCIQDNTICIQYTGCTNVYRIIQYVYSIQDAHIYRVYRMHTSIEYTGCTNVYRIIQYVYSIQDAHIYRVYRMHQCIQDNTNVYSIQDAPMYTVYRMHTSIEYTGCTNVYRIIQYVYSIQDAPMYTGCTDVYRIIQYVYSIQDAHIYNMKNRIAISDKLLLRRIEDQSFYRMSPMYTGCTDIVFYLHYVYRM